MIIHEPSTNDRLPYIAAPDFFREYQDAAWEFVKMEKKRFYFEFVDELNGLVFHLTRKFDKLDSDWLIWSFECRPEMYLHEIILNWQSLANTDSMSCSYHKKGEPEEHSAVVKLFDVPLIAGDYVTYHFRYSDRVQVGRVLRGNSTTGDNIVWVVFNCSNDWDQFYDYTAARVRIQDLSLGWAYDASEGNQPRRMKMDIHAPFFSLGLPTAGLVRLNC